ncbi:hypothetical protein HDU96_003917 [Phlyctochytrium bullatum]|nr:hypothetical protein HDU96_003917 [Phlyctochytrium bullatum]
MSNNEKAVAEDVFAASPKIEHTSGGDKVSGESAEAKQHNTGQAGPPTESFKRTDGDGSQILVVDEIPIGSAPKKNWRAGKPFITFVVFLGVFVDLFIYAVVIPFVPTLVQEFGGTNTDVGILLASYAAGILIFSPLMGVISDRWNNRKIPMIVSLSLLLASTLFFAFAKSYWALLVARFLQGAASTGVWVLGLALIADAFADDDAGMGQAMGYVLTAYTLGQLAGPPIGGAMFRFNRYSPFLLCGFFLIVDLISRLLVIDPNAPDQRPKPSDVDATVGETPRKKPMGFLELARLCPLVLLLTFLGSLVFTGFEPTLPLHLEHTFGYDEAKIGAVFLALIIPSVIAGPIGGMIYDRIGARKMLAPSLFSSAIVLIPIAWGYNIYWLVCGLFLIGILFTFGLTPLMPEIANSVPREAYAKGYALFNLAFSLGILVGPSVAAVLYDKLSWFWELIFMALFSFIPAIISLFYREKSKSEKTEPAEVTDA